MLKQDSFVSKTNRVLLIAYRNLIRNKGFSAINITGLAIGMAGVLSVMIALLTVSYQSVKAALANPVRNLRAE